VRAGGCGGRAGLQWPSAGGSCRNGPREEVRGVAEVTDALRDRDCIYQSPGVREGAAEAAWTRIAMRELQRATEVWRHLSATGGREVSHI